MSVQGEVGRAARLLGYAGLLPQVAVVAAFLSARAEPDPSLGIALGVSIAFAVALIYGAIILSFLGGIWWGFAMRRSTGQAELAAVAVIPSLAAAALVLASFLRFSHDRWTLVLLGEAPAGWMGLRVPLSLGLGLLTIAAGALVGR